MGKTIVVTGANRGIGREVARQLLAYGHTVIGTARKPETAPELNGLDLQKLDVTSDDSVQELRQYIISQYGRLDVVINNAAIMERSPLVDGNVDSIKDAMESNFYGPMRMNAAMIDLLRSSEDGRIVNVSSGMARR